MSNSVALLPNVIARVIKWDADGSAKVEILADAPGVSEGQVFLAKIRTVAFGFQPGDFLSLKKYGLRIGGIVLLRKVDVAEDGVLLARSVETIVARETDSFAVLLNDAAVCILPPKEGTKMVDRAIIVIGLNNSETNDPIGDFKKNQLGDLEKASQFGNVGIVLTGEDADGEVCETMIGGDKQRSASEILALFEETVPSAMIDEASYSNGPWRIAPYFEISIDPDRSSKLSAQRLNIAYGEGDELSWTRSNVVLRALGHSWLLCDASAGEDVIKQEAGLLLDVFEEAR
jgi:hypothetical protein